MKLLSKPQEFLLTAHEPLGNQPGLEDSTSFQITPSQNNKDRGHFGCPVNSELTVVPHGSLSHPAVILPVLPLGSAPRQVGDGPGSGGSTLSVPRARATWCGEPEPTYKQ